MSIRPKPSPSTVLVDPGDTPIVTGSFYYYDASRYSCNGTLCGQYLGPSIVTAGTASLTTLAFYTSSIL